MASWQKVYRVDDYTYPWVVLPPSEVVGPLGPDVYGGLQGITQGAGDDIYVTFAYSTNAPTGVSGGVAHYASDGTLLHYIEQSSGPLSIYASEYGPTGIRFYDNTVYVAQFADSIGNAGLVALPPDLSSAEYIWQPPDSEGSFNPATPACESVTQHLGDLWVGLVNGTTTTQSGSLARLTMGGSQIAYYNSTSDFYSDASGSFQSMVNRGMDWLCSSPSLPLIYNSSEDTAIYAWDPVAEDLVGTMTSSGLKQWCPPAPSVVLSDGMSWSQWVNFETRLIGSKLFVGGDPGLRFPQPNGDFSYDALLLSYDVQLREAESYWLIPGIIGYSEQFHSTDKQYETFVVYGMEIIPPYLYLPDYNSTAILRVALPGLGTNFTRQFPRDDNLGLGSPRQSVGAAPTSQQSSFRQGPANTYT